MHDVIVIGAGVAGASMACAMAARGWDTLLVDRHTPPRHKVCGEFLSPESRLSLSALGLAHLLAERDVVPSSIERIRLVSGSGRTLELPLPSPAQSVSRYALDYALQQEAVSRGAALRIGTTVRSIERSGQGWRLAVRSREHGDAVLEARAVIGAWGRITPAGFLGGDAAAEGQARELSAAPGNAAMFEDALTRSSYTSIRGGERTTGDMSGPMGGRRYIGVRTELSGVPAEPVVELYFFRGGYIGLVPSGDGRANAAALVTPEAFRAAGQSAAAVVAAAARAVPPLGNRLREAQPVPGSAAASPVALSRVPRAWGIVPHIGDAAAVIPPLCGDGMAMGLHAAMLCAPLADQYLRGTLTLDGWHAAYTEALQRDCAGPLRWGLLLQSGLGTPGLSPLLLGLGRVLPGVAHRLVKATRLRGRD